MKFTEGGDFEIDLTKFVLIIKNAFPKEGINNNISFLYICLNGRFMFAFLYQELINLIK